MSDDKGKDSSHLSDNWISSWEQQCVEEIENSLSDDLDERSQNERDFQSQKMLYHFQNAAALITQLYKDRQQGLAIWVPFQNAATAITTLYKEGMAAQKNSYELGLQQGYQRRTRDVLTWARKRRRHIRREELIGFLAGKPIPTRHHHHHGRVGASRFGGATLERGNMTRLPSPDHNTAAAEHDLRTFREALALQGLNGAMSNISVAGYNSRPHTPGSPSSVGGATATPHRQRNRSGLHHHDLSAFIADELLRNDSRKRTTDSLPTDSPSPTHKRSRLQ